MGVRKFSVENPPDISSVALKKEEKTQKESRELREEKSGKKRNREGSEIAVDLFLGLWSVCGTYSGIEWNGRGNHNLKLKIPKNKLKSRHLKRKKKLKVWGGSTGRGH